LNGKGPDRGYLPAHSEAAHDPGHYSPLPIAGILAAILLIAAFAITFYNFSIISGLQKNLSLYGDQLEGTTTFEKFGGQVIDFFSGGARTRRLEEVAQMNKDLQLGASILTVAVGFSGLALLMSLLGVFRNAKKAVAGRAAFATSAAASLVFPVLLFSASIILYTFTTLMLICLFCAFIAAFLLFTETRRIRKLKMAHYAPRHRN
jgi:hypothetical protein